MKCEHGKEITVIEELYGQYWDDGLIDYNEEGDSSGEFRKVEGCDVCKLIRYRIL